MSLVLDLFPRILLFNPVANSGVDSVLALPPRHSGVNQVWMASVLMLMPLLIGVTLSVLDLALQCLLRRPRGEFWGVLSCDPCVDNMSGSASVRFSNAEVSSVFPSSTFIVFKFQSVSNTSVLTADSPTFDPTGVALILHPVLGLVLGLLLERAESADSLWTAVCMVSSPRCTPTVALVLVCAVLLAYVVPVASLQSAAMCPGLINSYSTPACLLC